MTRPPVLRALPFVLLAVAMTACGPRVDVQTSVTSQLTSILLGAPKIIATPGVPVQAPAPSFPGIAAPPPVSIVAAPPPVVPVPVTVPPLKCPALSGLVFPKVPAQPLSAAAPAQGLYPYRQSGSSVQDSDPAVLLKGTDLRPVLSQSPATGATYTFNMIARGFGNTQVATTYSLVPPPTNQSVTVPGSAVGNPPETVQTTGGLYIQKIVRTDPSGSYVFAPVGPGVEVFQEPAAAGATWSSSASDPNAQLSDFVQGSISGHAVANACGQAIDTWQVTLTQMILGPSQNETIQQTLLVAPQYGCLIVDEVDKTTGTWNGHTITQRVHATLNTVPGSP